MVVPLQPLPNQTLSVSLDRQNAQIALRQNGGALYFDLSIEDSVIVRSRICRDRQRLLSDAKYRGFLGDFAFVDSQGVDDPQYLGLGADQSARFWLVFLSAGE